MGNMERFYQITIAILLVTSLAPLVSGFVTEPISNEINVVSPTPNSGSTVNAESVAITAITTLATPLSINWNGTNHSMTLSSGEYSKSLGGTGTFTYQIFGNDTEGVVYSEIRTVTLGYVALDTIPEVSVTSSNSIPLLDLEDYVSGSNVAVGNLDYSVEDNTSLVSCFVNSDNAVNCTHTGSDGSALVEVTVSDGIVSANASYVITIGTGEVTEPEEGNIAVTNVSGVIWDKNTIATLYLKDLFINHSAAMSYAASYVPDMTVQITPSAIYFIPTNNFLGKRNVTVITNNTAAYGSLYLDLTVVEPSARAEAVGESTSTQTIVAKDSDVVVEVPEEQPKKTVATETKPAPLATSLATQSISLKEDNSFVFNVDDQFDLSNLDAFSITTSVNGLIHVASSIDGKKITFTPEPDWYGSETAQITIRDGKQVVTGEVVISVANINDPPRLIRDVPPLNLNSERKEATLDLSEYYLEPDGEKINLSFDENNNVRAYVQNDHVVTFVLQEDFSEDIDEVLAYTLQDAAGNKITGAVHVSFNYIPNATDTAKSLIPQIILMLVLVGAIGFFSYKKIVVPARTNKLEVHAAVNKDPEHFVKKVGQRFGSFSSVGFKDVFDSLRGALTTASTDWKLSQQEPHVLRRELLYVKETVSSMRAIISSCKDPVVAKSLTREKDALLRSYHTLLGKEEMVRDDLRALMLTVMQAESTFRDIANISENFTMRNEIRWHARRMHRVLQWVSFKIQDSYEDHKSKGDI